MDLSTYNATNEGQEIILYLQTCTTDKNGVRYLSAKCITPLEWDYEINRLIKQLEKTRNRGNRLLNKLWKWSWPRELI
jgi:hypothetical protein